MSNLAIIKVKKDPKAKLKVHGGETKAGGIRPVCGGGRDGRSVQAWNTDFQGVRALSCKRCLKILLKRAKKQGKRACRKCGCTEDNACITKHGPCAWSKVDPKLCTACE